MAQAKAPAFKRSRDERKKVEMAFAHMKRIFKLDRFRLRGLSGARDEVLLVATAQNLRKLARYVCRPPPIPKKPKIHAKTRKQPTKRKTPHRHRPDGGWKTYAYSKSRHRKSTKNQVLQQNRGESGHKSPFGKEGRAEGPCLQVQMSTFSAISKASSTSMPKYLTVLSILECPRSS